MQYMSALVF